MNLTVKINVTRSHIFSGSRGACGSCPVALAVRDALGGNCVRASVRLNETAVWMKGQRRSMRAYTPKVAREFIRRFDDVGLLGAKPCSFTLNFRNAPVNLTPKAVN